MGLTIHIGAQLHGELRGVCQPFLSTYRTEVVHGCHHLLSWHQQASPRPGGVVGVLEEHNPPCMPVKNGRSVLQFVAKESEWDRLRTNDAE